MLVDEKCVNWMKDARGSMIRGCKAEIRKNLEEFKLTEGFATVVKGKPRKHFGHNVRVRKLEAGLAESVSKIEHEAIIAVLQLRTTDLETRLRESMSEANALKEKVACFESRPGQADPARETTGSSLQKPSLILGANSEPFGLWAHPPSYPFLIASQKTA